MSDLTPCNFCNLKRIKEASKAKGYITRITHEGASFGLGGVNIISYPKGIILPKSGTKERSEFNKKYFVAWFMELPGYCCC